MRKWRKGAAACWLVLVILGSAIALPGRSAAVEWRVATPYPVDSFHVKNLQQFGEALARESKGAVTLQIHPNAVLVKSPEIFGAVKAGKVDGGEVILSSLAKESSLFSLDALPFVVRGYEDAYLLWKLSRPAIEKRFFEHGLQILYSVPWPPQNLYSNRPLARPKDFEGLRLRTYNPTMERLAELLNAKSVTLQTAELADAIAGQKLDLMLTSSWTGVEAKAWTGFGYYYDVNGWIPKNVVFVNKAKFDALEPAIQSKIKALAAEAEERGWHLSKQNSTRFDQELVANKIKVLPLDHFLMRQLQRHGEKLAVEWLRTEGGDGLDILLRFQSEVFKQGVLADQAKR